MVEKCRYIFPNSFNLIDNYIKMNTNKEMKSIKEMKDKLGDKNYIGYLERVIKILITQNKKLNTIK